MAETTPYKKHEERIKRLTEEALALLSVTDVREIVVTNTTTDATFDAGATSPETAFVFTVTLLISKSITFKVSITHDTETNDLKLRAEIEGYLKTKLSH